MLRYRSYSVDFLTKPKEFLQDAEVDSTSAHLACQSENKKDKLRFGLFHSALEQVKFGLEQKKYFEVICLCQAIMTERIGYFLQDMQGIEDKYKVLTGLEETVSNLLSYIDLQGKTPEPDLMELFTDLCRGQKGTTWVDRRDTSLHEYLLVLDDNMSFTGELRDEFNRRTAEIGVKLAMRTIQIIDALLVAEKRNAKDINANSVF